MSSFNPAVFRARRQKLLDSLPPQSLALIPAAQLVTRSRDTEYPFRQASNFWYLTGYAEPDALLVLAKGLVLDKGKPAAQQLLFNLPKDPLMETWTGIRVGQEQAVSQYGLDSALPLTELDTYLPKLLAGADEVWLALENAELHADYLRWRSLATAANKRLTRLPARLVDLNQHLGEERLIKQPEEIQLLTKAAHISAQAHCRAMRMCQPGMYEYQLQAELEHEFKIQGASAPAYGSIVGSGANACVLHYVDNQAVMQAGDLVLIDAGAEYQGYAGDITRTFPVNGKFSPPQLQLYNLVLQANQLAISLAKPGASLEQLHQAVIACLTQGLVDLGLLTGTVEELITNCSYKTFFMHGTSHWLGLDVHDVGQYLIAGQPRSLEPGMVFTVEPGLYIAPETPGIDPKWQGIGIRIEDNLLITATGCEVLTSGVPKDPQAIEDLMSAAPIQGEASGC